MKRLKITSVLLSVVMCVSMAFPSIGVIADEAAEPTETQTEATEKKQEPKATEKKQTTTAPEKKQEPKETEKKEEPKETAKQEPKETEKKEEPKETVKQEPKETERKEEPKETAKQEPKETEKKEEPKETAKQEPAVTETQEPKETEKKEEPTETEKPAPEETETKESKETESQAPTETDKKQEPAETETTAPSETETQASEETEPEKVPEATEVPGGKVTKTPKNALFTNVKFNSSTGILTWDAVADADEYMVLVGENNNSVDKWAFSVIDESADLYKVIRYCIKNELIKKTNNNVYYIRVQAYKENSQYHTIGYSEIITVTYETNVKPVVTTDFTTVNLSDKGVLSWSAVANAHHYDVEILGHSNSITSSTTALSLNLKDAIDKAVKEHKFLKEEDNSFYIYLRASDSDDVGLAYAPELSFKYSSNATPGALTSIPNAIIKSGKLTWGNYTGKGFDHYKIRLVDENKHYAWYGYYESPDTVDLKNMIGWILSRDYSLSECSKYTVELYAMDAYGDILAGFIQTYTYKELNTLSVSGKTAKVKKKKVRKKKQTLNVGKVIKFKNRGQGKITYSKISGSKKISINGSNGKVTVKKKTKKGTYKVSVWVKAAGDANHFTAKKKVTFKIKVK